MEWLDILKRIEAGENRRTEVKCPGDLSAVGKAICALQTPKGVLSRRRRLGNSGVKEDAEKVQERDLVSSYRLQCACLRAKRSL